MIELYAIKLNNGYANGDGYDLDLTDAMLFSSIARASRALDSLKLRSNNTYKWKVVKLSIKISDI